MKTYQWIYSVTQMEVALATTTRLMELEAFSCYVNVVSMERAFVPCLLRAICITILAL